MLSGVGLQEREPLLRIKIVDLNSGNADGLAGSSARRRDGVMRKRFLPEIDLGWGCACETLVGP